MRPKLRMVNDYKPKYEYISGVLKKHWQLTVVYRIKASSVRRTNILRTNYRKRRYHSSHWRILIQRVCWETPKDDGTNFTMFWRNIGSSKKETEIAVHGDWETVFPGSSQLKHFGLTIQNDTKEELLMGASYFPIHKVEDQEGTYDSLGYYCRLNTEDSGHFQEPLSKVDAETINKLKNFSLKRTTESGFRLSFRIQPRIFSKEKTVINMVHSVIVQYFLPIITKQLEVVSIRRATIIINDDSVDQIEKITRYQKKFFFDPNLRAGSLDCEYPRSQIKELGLSLKNAKYTSWENLQPPDDFEEYQSAYKSLEPMKFPFPSSFIKTSQEIKKDTLSCYIQKLNSHHYSFSFIRQGLLIVMSETRPRLRNVGVMNCGAGYLGSFLQQLKIQHTTIDQIQRSWKSITSKKRHSALLRMFSMSWLKDYWVLMKKKILHLSPIFFQTLTTISVRNSPKTKKGRREARTGWSHSSRPPKPPQPPRSRHVISLRMIQGLWSKEMKGQSDCRVQKSILCGSQSNTWEKKTNIFWKKNKGTTWRLVDFDLEESTIDCKCVYDWSNEITIDFTS